MLVILESPFAGFGLSDERKNVALNVEYGRAALRDCLLRGEAPFASHLLYAQVGVLDDSIREERELGIVAGFEWRRFASKTVVYADRGVSSGMLRGIEHAHRLGQTVEYRSLRGWD